MPQPTSSIQTGALTLSAASLVPIIDWAASRLNITIPVDAQLQIAALLITVGHAVYNLLLERRIGIAQGSTAYLAGIALPVDNAVAPAVAGAATAAPPAASVAGPVAPAAAAVPVPPPAASAT
ncbi:hypothetical protein [Burkholderia glumae]|uniref:hypothetical protein n=1 Tax=Burkholderia glumae TaxID=337 RepID=UPI0003A9FA31|nr:hypothetical protein [Burkholderia glumae]